MISRENSGGGGKGLQHSLAAWTQCQFDDILELLEMPRLDHPIRFVQHKEPNMADLV